MNDPDPLVSCQTVGPAEPAGLRQTSVFSVSEEKHILWFAVVQRWWCVIISWDFSIIALLINMSLP